MVEGVLFDFFGTLVNYTHGRTGQDFTKTHELLNDHGVILPIDDVVTRFDRIFVELEQTASATQTEFSMHDAVTRFLAEVDGAAENTFVDQLVAQYIDDWAQDVEFLHGLEAHLRSLARRYRLGIITNTHHAPMIHDFLQQMNVATHFELVMTSIEHGRPKPHRSIFDDTLKAMALTAEQAVYVGDSFEADYKGATGVGMGCYLIGRHARVPVDRQIPSVLDLPAKLGR